MDKLAFNKTAERRKDYFSSKGIANVPYEQDGRYSKAKEFVEQTHPDYESAAMLFDKIDDFDHAGFLVLMGSVYAAENSPYYNLEEALKFLKKAYIYSENTDQKIHISKEILSGYFYFKGIKREDYPHTYDDPFVLETILFLRSQNIEPETVSQNRKIQKGQFYEAGIYGAGNGVGKDAEKSLALYRGYIDTGEEGYFSASYKNLAIRYVLGLGCDQNLGYAYNLVRTGRIILEEMPYEANDSILNALSKIHMEARAHSHIYENIASRYNKTESAWSFLDMIHDAQPQHRNAVVNALSLYAVLAKREKWKDIEDWEKLYNYALSHFSMESKDKLKILSEGDELIPEKFHPQIIQQEKNRLHLRDQRIRMYEYFRDHDLGIPPVDQKERYQLALKFRNQQRINYDAIHVLFDPEEDAGHADWLYLIGCVHDEARQYYDPQRAFSYYKQASGLGHGAASYKVGKRYEEGNVILIDLDEALRFYKLSKTQGYDQSQTSIERISSFLDELYSMSNDQKVHRKIFDLYKYFQDNNLGVVPVSQDARNNYATSLATQVPPDYEFSLKLFIPETDSKHSNWLLLMGFIHNDHINNPHFDSEKAFNYYTQSSELGNSAASNNLALKYSGGKENEIDIDAAIYWWEKAKQQGSVDADYQIVSQSIEHDSRYYSSHERNFRITLLKRIMEAADNGSFLAKDHVARIFGAGRDCDQLDSKVIDLYNEAVIRSPQYHEEPTKYGMVWRYALRAYLGLGVDSDNKFALKLLGIIPEISNSTYINQTLKELSETLKGIVASEDRDPSSFSDVKWAVQNCYQHKGNPQNINIRSTAYAVDVLWCVNQLAFGEEWLDRYQWQELLRKTQAKFMGLDYSDIYRSTLFEGPRYNPTSSNGMPVLGIWEKPSIDHKVTAKHFVDTGSYVPESGVVKFKGLHTNNEGTITFDFVKSSDQPAFLVPEDFEIALVLAFGNPDGLVQPYLSLEDPNRHGIKDKHRVFKFKEWNPHWLGYTDLGRTLYMTDQLIGRLCWMPREFDIGASNQTFDPRAKDYALNLVEDIALTGGRSGAGAYSRVMLVPEHISIQASSNEQGHIYIDVSEVKMRIDGDYMIVGEGKDKDLHLNLNDDMYQQGRTVNKLTRRYNDVAAMMPAFARAQELMALLHATRSLRNVMDQTGSKLNRDWHNRIMTRYREFEAMPPLPRHEQLCVPLPLEYKRI